MENSRIPFLKVAKIFGVSETAMRKRVKKMEEMGIIRKYTVDVDPKKIGFKVTSPRLRASTGRLRCWGVQEGLAPFWLVTTTPAQSI